VKSQSDEIARWTKSRSGEIAKVDEIAKQRNREVAKSREDLGRRIWGIYEGSIAIRYGEAARRISPRVIQLPKTVKESWSSIGDSRGPLIQEGRMAKDQSMSKLHLGVSCIMTWSDENLHHKNREMRTHDKIWTVRSPRVLDR
jgi:hypothetical protein